MTLKPLRKITLALLLSSSLIACAPKNQEPVHQTGSTSPSQTNTMADWKLVPDESGMTYITIKNGELAEINTFRKISGTVTHDGKADITIDLGSVDTNSEIRDGRLKEFLFDIKSHPEAKITANINMDPLINLPIGASHTLLLDMNIALRGVDLQQDFYVLATRLGENKVVVNNKAPLILHAEDFAMTDALEQLRELAKLDTITPVVTATVSFVFKR